MEILTTNLVCNGWTNHLYEIEVHIDREYHGIPVETIHKENDEAFVYGEDGSFVSYGVVDKTGYRWSSRCSVFNGQFGKKCMEVTIIDTRGYRIGGNMKVDEVLKFLPEGYYIAEITEADEKGNICEINYSITNAEHEKQRAWNFEDVVYSSGATRKITNRIGK